MVACKTSKKRLFHLLSAVFKCC
uniref:Uncharacterized protein n=1 Tax=Rhizophora mucronata TaxID=61149 RepID=A0A2P2NAK4_RHIMU